MLDRFQVMKIFEEVAKNKSFSKAASNLRLSPSSITKEIKKLEEHLGSKLLSRTTRSVSLTEPGQFYLKQSLEIMEQMRELEEALQGQASTPKGQLRITAPTVLGQKVIAPLLAQFQQSYPQIQIELILTDRVIDVVEDGFDLAFRTSMGLKDSSLYSQHLGGIKRVICASPGYIKKHGKPRKVEDLEKHQILIFIRGEAEKQWVLEKNNQLVYASLDGAIKCNNLLALLEMAKKDQGIISIPDYLIRDELSKGKLISLYKGYQMSELKLYLLYHQPRRETQKMRIFLDFFQKKLKNI